MPAFGLWELQKSIFQLLTGDSTLMALVNGVFDHVPQGTSTPYVVVGEATARDWGSATGSGMQVTSVIRVYSREGGHKQASSILARIYQLLHQANLAVSGQNAVLSRYDSSAVEMQPDGLTRMGVIRFQVLLESA